MTESSEMLRAKTVVLSSRLHGYLPINSSVQFVELVKKGRLYSATRQLRKLKQRMEMAAQGLGDPLDNSIINELPRDKYEMWIRRVNEWETLMRTHGGPIRATIRWHLGRRFLKVPVSP